MVLAKPSQTMKVFPSTQLDKRSYILFCPQTFQKPLMSHSTHSYPQKLCTQQTHNLLSSPYRQSYAFASTSTSSPANRTSHRTSNNHRTSPSLHPFSEHAGNSTPKPHHSSTRKTPSSSPTQSSAKNGSHASAPLTPLSSVTSAFGSILSPTPIVHPSRAPRINRLGMNCLIG